MTPTEWHRWHRLRTRSEQGQSGTRGGDTGRTEGGGFLQTEWQLHHTAPPLYDQCWKGEIWEREKNGARASQPRFFMPSVWLLWMLIQVKISAKCCSDCKTLSVGQIGCSFAVKNSSSNSLHWISPTPFGKWQLLCVVFKSWNGVSTSTEDLGPCVCPVILLLKVF